MVGGWAAGVESQPAKTIKSVAKDGKVNNPLGAKRTRKPRIRILDFLVDRFAPSFPYFPRQHKPPLGPNRRVDPADGL